MFNNIHQHAGVLHDEMKVVFWLLLPPLLLILITFEILKSEDSGPNVQDILKRTVLAILMLMFMDYTINVIAFISDGIAEKISSKNELLAAVKNFGPKPSDSTGGFFDFRRHVIYFFAIASYLISYIGYFASVALVNFVWAILYVSSPLMILCYVPRSTSSITTNLYKGIINVSVWKIVWALLGALLLKMAIDPQIAGIEDYFLALVMNLIIGVSMLLIPFFTKSLISDGLQSASTALASAPGLLTARALTYASKSMANKGLKGAGKGLNFSSKPLTNPITGRLKLFNDKAKLGKRFKQAKNSYKNLGLPDEAKELINKQRRKKYAINQRRKK